MACGVVPLSKEIIIGRLPRARSWMGQRHVSLRRFVLELYPPGTWERIRGGDARVEVDGITLEEVNSQIPTVSEVVVFARVDDGGRIGPILRWKQFPARVASGLVHRMAALKQVFPRPLRRHR